MKMKDIPQETFKKLDVETQTVIIEYVNELHPNKGYSEKIELLIEKKLNEVN